MFQYDPAEALSRPILTYGQIYSGKDGLSNPYQACLLETKGFLKLFERLYQIKLPRRTLQIYSSPGFRLLPLPVHKGGYKSYYLNPEHTVRLGVVMHLQRRHYFPLKTIQKVMKELPEEHYRYILKDTLTGEEILDSALLVKDGYSIKDILFRKVCRVLESIEEPYWKAVEKYGKGADKQHEKYVDQALIKEARGLSEWIGSGRRRKVELAGVGRMEREQDEVISWLREIEEKSEAVGRA